MNRNHPLLFMILLLQLFSAALHAERADHSAPLTFGVVPQQAAGKLLLSWLPTLSYLQEYTGREFTFRTARDIPTFEERVADGEYDFAYMNPYHYTVFHDAPGYQAVARARDKRIQGILVVHKDSTVTRLEQLVNEDLAFPAPAAFAASLLPRAHLKQLGIAFRPRYVASHDSVYHAVAKGLMPAGGGVKRTLNASPPPIRDQLRVLWATPGYTPHAIAVHPRVETRIVQQVQEALVSMQEKPRGLAALDALKLKGFEPAVNSDWDDVRSLNLDAALGRY